MRQLIYRITTTEQQKHLELGRQLDFAYGIRGLARFRVNAYYQRESLAAAFRTIPADIQSLEELGLPASLHELTKQAARPRARHRPDRLGQVDDARLDDRRDQPNAHRSHHHDRGSDRVPPPPQALHRQPARDRARRDRLRRRAPRRAASGPRRDPPRRDARPRDDLDRADRGRDRPPRLRHAAHAERAEHDRPHHRRLPRRAAGAGADAARQHAPGHRHPDAAPDRRRRGRVSRPSRSSSSTTRSGT